MRSKYCQCKVNQKYFKKIQFQIWNFKPNHLPLHHTNKQTEIMNTLSDQIVSKMICEGVTLKNISKETAKIAMKGTVSEAHLLKFIEENYDVIEMKFKSLMKSFGH